MNQIKQGYKQTKVGIIPEDWEVVKIKEVAKVKDGTHFSPKSTTGDFKYITSKNIKFGYLDLSDISYVSEEEHKVIYKSCPVKNGDLLLTKDGANTGNACINTLNEEFSLLSSVAFIDGFENTLFNQFLLQQILWNKTQTRLQAEMSGQAITRLTITKIDSFNIILPPLKEQEKIAEILTTWDETITKQEELIKAKELQKKGLMQKLLSGEVRFNGFNDEWEEVRLGEICKITTGKLNANAMVENGQYTFFTCARETYRIDDFAFDTEALLVSGNGANVGYIHYFNGKFNAYQRTYVLDGFKHNIFLIKYLLDKYLSLQISREKNEGNTPYITLPTLTKMKLKLPSLAEQQKIAEVLSLVDDEINLLKNELEELKLQKKALMQKLLTGEVRVKA